VVICLERGADLHTAQLMPLPLTVCCFSEIQIGFTFLVPADPGSPGRRAVTRVCVCLWFRSYGDVIIVDIVCFITFSGGGKNYSYATACRAPSSKPTARCCCCRSTGQTDGRTDTRPLHRLCSAYCAGSGNNVNAIPSRTSVSIYFSNLLKTCNCCCVGC